MHIYKHNIFIPIMFNTLIQTNARYVLKTAVSKYNQHQLPCLLMQ